MSHYQKDQLQRPGSRRLHVGHGLVALALLGGVGLAARNALAAGHEAKPLASTAASLQIATLSAELDLVKGKLAVTDLKLERFAKIAEYSRLYQIPNDVAARIYDAALAEGIHPSLGYQLVKVESRFKANARSSAGALGYTQVRLRTAQAHRPSLTERQLLDPDQNLRIGFGILRRLLNQFDQDLELALRAYNLGPTGAVLAMADSTDSSDGKDYAARVMNGMKRVKVKY